MKKEHSRRFPALLAAVIAILAMAGTTLFAQSYDFENNTGGTYLADDGTGKVVMRGTGGAAGAGQFSGTAPLGQTVADRIQGTVEWRREGAQTVQGTLFYTHLNLEGIAGGAADTKDIEDNVYVFGFYRILANCGDRDYNPSGGNNTFHYNNDGVTTYTWTLNDGATTTTDQVINGEGASSGNVNRYNNLDIYGGAKRTEDIVNCMGTLTNSNDDATATLLITNNFTVGDGVSDVDAQVDLARASNTDLTGVADPIVFQTTGTGSLTLGAAVGATPAFNVAANGLLDLKSTGDFTVNGTLDLADNGGVSDGALNVGYDAATPVDANLLIPGTFTNNAAVGSRTNMTFAENSDVRYQQAGSGTPVVAATNNTNPENKYGNLYLEGSSVKYVDGSVYMRGDLSVADANFEVGPNGTGPSDDLTTADFLDMDVTATPTVTYDNVDNTRYVLGKMRVSGTIPTATPIKFNNELTTVTFQTAPSNAGGDHFFELDIFPGDRSDPVNQIKCQKDADWLTENLRRHIRMTYTSDAANVQISTLVAGYVGATDKDGSYSADETNMRFYEGYDATMTDEQQKILIPGQPVADAVLNGNKITLDENGSGNFIEPIAAAGGGTVQEVSNTSDIILGSSPILYITVQDGRWSHATTWDEGVVPTYENDTEIRHLCYTGIDQAAFNVDDWDDDEINGSTDDLDANGAARSITIRRKQAANTWYHPALVVGHNDVNYAANTNRSFRTILTTDATDLEQGAIINMNDGQDEDTGVLTPNMWGPGDGLNISYDASGTTDVFNRIQGVFVMEPRGVGSGSEYWPILGAGKITNSGRIVNEGVIEVGR